MVHSMISAIALDLGTTSIKAALLGQDGRFDNMIARAAPEIKAKDGCYESDALHYAETADQVLAECQAQAGKSLPLGLCSQRSSFLIWDKASGQSRAFHLFHGRIIAVLLVVKPCGLQKASFIISLAYV